MSNEPFSGGATPEFQASLPSSTTARANARRYLFPIAISLAVLVGLLLRWVNLGSQSLWWDEGFTLWISKFSPADICRGLQFDTSPPVYYLLEHYWGIGFGSSDASLRGMSALFETLSFPLFFALAEAVLADKRAVAIAMWLFGLSAFQITYAREARFYGLLSLISIGTLYWLVCFLERRTVPRFISLVILISAGLYTHNMMLFYLPAIAAFWLIYPSRRSKTVRAIELAGTMLLVLLLYLPWVPTLLKQTRSIEGSFWVPRPTARTLLETLCSLSGLEPDYLSRIAQRLLHIGPSLAGPIVFFSALVIFSLCIFGGTFRVMPSNQRKVIAIFSYVSLPVLFVFAISRLSTPVYLDRGFIASSTALPILYCAPIAFRADSRGKLYSRVALAIMLMVSISLLAYLRYSAKEDWRGLATFSTGIHNRQRLIVFLPYQAQILYDHYRDEVALRDPHVAETGLPVPFDFGNPVRLYTSDFPTRPAFESFVDVSFASRKYEELDVVFAHVPDEVARMILEALNTQCSQVIDRDFRRVRFVRCDAPSTRSTPQNSHE